MKYQCEVIKDLLPLYVDDVCSKESKKIVEEHLEICDSCKQYYNAMKSYDNNIISEDKNNEILADSLQKVKKQITVKNILSIVATFLIVLIFMGISIVAAIGMSLMETIILYEDNIFIDQNIPKGWEEWYEGSEGDYFVHCKGRKINGVEIEVVEVPEGDKIEKYLFFQLQTNKWSDLITTKNKVSHQPFSDISYFDKVYYYPGYMVDLEAIADGELPILIETSTLLWEK